MADYKALNEALWQRKNTFNLAETVRPGSLLSYLGDLQSLSHQPEIVYFLCFLTKLGRYY